MFLAVFFPANAGALLTGRPAQAANKVMAIRVASAEKTNDVADRAKVLAGRVKFFMSYDVSSGLR